MLIKRYDYNCNFTNCSSPTIESSSSTPNSLFEMMKEYAVIDEPVIVYSSQLVDTTSKYYQKDRN